MHRGLINSVTCYTTRCDNLNHWNPANIKIISQGLNVQFLKKLSSIKNIAKDEIQSLAQSKPRNKHPTATPKVHKQNLEHPSTWDTALSLTNHCAKAERVPEQNPTGKSAVDVISRQELCRYIAIALYFGQYVTRYCNAEKPDSSLKALSPFNY